MAEEDEKKFQENEAQEKAQVVENAGREGLPKAESAADVREAAAKEDVRVAEAKGGGRESASEGDEMKTAQLSEAEEAAPEKKRKKSIGKRILRAGLILVGADKVYDTYADAFRKDDKSVENRPKKAQRMAEATLKVTGAKDVYDEAAALFKKDKSQDKKSKKVIKKIIQSIKVVCKAGIFVCRCLMKAVGPGVYVVSKILKETLIAANTAQNAVNAKNGKAAAFEVVNGAINMVLPDGENKLSKGVNKVADKAEKADRAVRAASELSKDDLSALVGTTVRMDTPDNNTDLARVSEVLQSGQQRLQEARARMATLRAARQAEEASRDAAVADHTAEHAQRAGVRKPDPFSALRMRMLQSSGKTV